MVAFRKVRIQRGNSTKDGENAPQEAAENTLNSTPTPTTLPLFESFVVSEGHRMKEEAEALDMV